VSCTARGVINVKGKGEMRTHFVDLDEELRVVPINQEAEDAIEDNTQRFVSVHIFAAQSEISTFYPRERRI
jgi:hypothetical protein